MLTGTISDPSQKPIPFGRHYVQISSWGKSLACYCDGKLYLTGNTDGEMVVACDSCDMRLTLSKNGLKDAVVEWLQIVYGSTMALMVSNNPKDPLFAETYRRMKVFMPSSIQESRDERVIECLINNGVVPEQSGIMAQYETAHPDRIPTHWSSVRLAQSMQAFLPPSWKTNFRKETHAGVKSPARPLSHSILLRAENYLNKKQNKVLMDISIRTSCYSCQRPVTIK